MAKYDGIDFRPPKGARTEAQRGLDWRREFGRGGTAVGIARARDIAAGRKLSPETVRRMKAYFDRHESDKKGKGWSPGDEGYPSNGRIAWALWGGDPGRGWAAKVVKRMNARDEKASAAARAPARKPVAATGRAFREALVPGEALAIDPGGSGLIRAAARGRQPAPQAFGLMFSQGQSLAYEPEHVEDGVAVLCVQGPLEHHESWFHSYEDLAREIDCALADAAVKAVVLKIDSPGGVAAGMGECHRAIRRASKRHKKPVYAYADEMACSAAYHLASACSEVWTSESGHLGSVGVILCTIDETARLEREGVAVRYLVTGARKADLHDGQPVTDDVVAAAQGKVDKLGEQFFRAVANARGKAPNGAPLATPEKVRALQAGVFVGDDAVRVGLADGIAPWSDFMSYVKDSIRATIGTGGNETQRPAASRGVSHMGKSLAKIAADGKKAKEARSLLASLAALLGAAPEEKKMAEEDMKKGRKARMSEDGEKCEDDDKDKDMEEEEEEEEEESKYSDTDMPSDSEEEEEEEEEKDSESDKDMEEEEEEEKYEEEEEEEAISASVLAAAYAKADAAFLASIPKHLRMSAGIRTPSRLLRAARRATGRQSVDAVMGALSALPVATKAHKKIAADVAKIKQDQRDEKINRIIKRAQSEGRAGASSADGRESLRAIGRKHGSGFLAAHVATLPKLRTTAAAPKADIAGGPVGAPTRDEQSKILDSLFAGMKPQEREAAMADYANRATTNAPKMPRS